MDKEAATIALVLITILAVFVAIQPLIPSNTERFSELGLLGPGKLISNYPTNVTIGSPILLYGYVGNHQGTVEYYQVYLKLGDSSTVISNSTSANLPVIKSYSCILDDGQNITFPINLSFNQSALRQRLIFELWSYNLTTSSFAYTGLWNQLWINVTATAT